MAASWPARKAAHEPIGDGRRGGCPSAIARRADRGRQRGTGAPETLLAALEARFLADAAPRDLTLFHVTGIGAVATKGWCHLAHPGLVKRVIGGNYGLQLPFMALIRDECLEAYNFP